MKCKNIQQLWTSSINVLCVLSETFRNFINIVTKPGHHDYIGKV